MNALSKISNFPWKMNNTSSIATNISNEAPDMITRKARRGRPSSAQIKAQQEAYSLKKKQLQSEANLQIENMINEQSKTQKFVIPESDIHNRLAEIVNVVHLQGLKIDLLAKGLNDISKACGDVTDYLLNSTNG